VLHGATIFHLAARFDSASLKVLAQFLKFKGAAAYFSEQVAVKTENDVGRTPLHAAAGNPSPVALG
jgi:hypothetical protein